MSIQFPQCLHYIADDLTQNDLQPAREEFCPVSSATPAPSNSPTLAEEKPSFSMDYNTMDYNRLLSHFDLGGKPQGKSSRKSSGRRSRQNSSSSTLVGIVDLSRKTTAGQTESEFGRRFSIGEKTKITASKQSSERIVQESAAIEFGRQVKRLRKRITV